MREVLLLSLVVGACSRPDPGISREKAEAVLGSFNLTDLSLQPTPVGWTGTARPQGGGYRMSVTVDRQGVMELKPDDCRC
jgi:hypothetical protein